MTLFYTPLNDITETQVRALWEDGTLESATCDFKELLDSWEKKGKAPGDVQDEEKVKLASDIAAFANASGGDIIVGIPDSDGVATEPDLKRSREYSADEIENFVRQVCDSKLEPRYLHPIHARIIPVTITGGATNVLIIRIPSGASSPYAVKKGDGYLFKKRMNRHNSPMDIQAVRTELVGAAASFDKIKKDRDEIYVGVRERPVGRVYSHPSGIPTLAFFIQPYYGTRIPPSLSMIDLKRLSEAAGLDHFIISRHGRGDRLQKHITPEGYTSIAFHDETNECLWEEFMWFRDGTFMWCLRGGIIQGSGRVLPWATFHQELTKNFRKIQAAYAALGLSSSAVVSMMGDSLSSLFVEFPANPFQSSRRFDCMSFRTDYSWIEDVTMSGGPDVLKTVFDQAWNAAGLLEAPNASTTP